MNAHSKSTETENVPCKTCLTEIPHSKAKIVEVDDYVMNFCGLECYEKWQKEKTENNDAAHHSFPED